MSSKVPKVWSSGFVQSKARKVGSKRGPYKPKSKLRRRLTPVCKCTLTSPNLIHIICFLVGFPPRRITPKSTAQRDPRSRGHHAEPPTSNPTYFLPLFNPCSAVHTHIALWLSHGRPTTSTLCIVIQKRCPHLTFGIIALHSKSQLSRGGRFRHRRAIPCAPTLTELTSLRFDTAICV